MSTCSCPATISPGSIVGADLVIAHSCHAAGRALPAAREIRSKGRRNWGFADKVRLGLEKKNYAHRHYRKIVAVSNGVARELTAYYGVPSSDIFVVPNGVDADHFHPRLRATSGKEIRSSLGIGDERKVILFVGNEFRRKGLDLLIRALGLMMDATWSLVVVGDDDPSAYTSVAAGLGIADRIHFCGKTADTAPFYAAADLFVLPSAYEAWPLAMTEAAASALPVFITRVNGAEEFIVDGVNGYFVDRSPHDIAGRIIRCLGDQKERMRLGACARESALTFTWTRTVDAIEEILESMVSARRPK
jgi:glycosyltransferase involved in cell wall biosynthesis